MNDPRARIDALFDRALDLDADARAAFLAELAAHDPASHAELETLLRLAHAPGSRLDPHAIVAGPLWQALAEADPGAGDAPPVGATAALPVSRDPIKTAYVTPRLLVIPAKAGIQCLCSSTAQSRWIPAFAEMTTPFPSARQRPCPFHAIRSRPPM